jgi:hypothetical protein
MKEAYIGVHVYHPDGRYDDQPKYTSRRNELILKPRSVLLLAESTIASVKERYDLSKAIVIPTETEDSPLPVGGWKQAIDLIQEHFPASLCIIWGAELILSNVGFDRHQGCVGETYKRLTPHLEVSLEEDNCYVLENRVNWSTFFMNRFEPD